MSTNVVQHLSVPKQSTGQPNALQVPGSAAAKHDGMQHGGIISRPKALPPPSPVTPTVMSPDICVCKDFPWPKGERDPKSHHPICMHYDAWRSANPETPEATPKEKLYLLDLDTKTVMREATMEEVQESEEEEKRSGTPMVKIDDKLYGVVSPP